MTRVTKMGRKKFLKASFSAQEFTVKPLIPKKRKDSDADKQDHGNYQHEQKLKAESGNDAAQESLQMTKGNQNISQEESAAGTNVPIQKVQEISIDNLAGGNQKDSQKESSEGKKKRIRHRDPKEKAEKVNTDKDPSQDVNPHAHLAGLSKQEREILKRRSRKQKAKERKMECYLCRQKGHSIANCPRNTGQLAADAKESFIHGADGSSICYRCGSLEHILQKCDQKHNPKDPLPFSTCFVCKQKGHLAGQCELNEKGVYPNGGCCKYCSSVRHLAQDCQKMQDEARVNGTITLGTIDLEQGADDDDQFLALYKKNQDQEALKSAKSSMKNISNPDQSRAEQSQAAQSNPSLVKKIKKVVVFK